MIRTQVGRTSHSQVPVADGPRRRLATLGVILIALTAGTQSVLAQDWLQWGGPKGDFTVESTGLANQWGEGGPKQLWKRPLGEGYSSILVKDGRLYTMYRDGDDEIVIALEAKSGGTIWEFRYPRKLWPEMDRNFGEGPNATPLITGDRIVAVGIDGQLHCLDLAGGKVLWKHELPAKFGRRKRVEEYGYSNSPLAYRNTLIVQVGGDDVAVVALKPQDGSIVWKSEPGGVSYAPASVIRLAGRDQFIYFEPEGVVSLDPAKGTTLWKSPIQFNNGNHLTPIVQCDDSHIWVASQFLTGGGRLLEITEREGKLAAKQVWFDKRLRASHWTSIRLGDHIYGSIGGNNASFLTALNWKTGKRAWRKRGFHKAQALFADEKLIFLDENGILAMGRVSPSDFEVLASTPMTEGVSWTLPTLVGTELYLRDMKNIIALDLSESAN